MTLIDIKYTWPPRSSDPREICSIEIAQAFVPRLEDDVYLEYEISEETVNVSLVVKRVVWVTNNNNQKVVLHCSR